MGSHPLRGQEKISFLTIVDLQANRTNPSKRGSQAASQQAKIDKQASKPKQTFKKSHKSLAD
jgi:hypothetical protein